MNSTQIGTFIISKDAILDSKIHIKIKGLGYITINHTFEGVIIDAYDNSDINDSIGSLALDESDFEEQYCTELSKSIGILQPEEDVSGDFTRQAYADEITICEAIESYFSDYSFNVDNLKPLNSKLDINISNTDNYRAHPYIKINKQQFKQLQNGNADYYQAGGNTVFTFGQDNDGYLLFSVKPHVAQKILENEHK